ncbi:MAG: hypothetical protein ACM3S4_04315 [Burkholderiales bacterium]
MTLYVAIIGLGTLAGILFNIIINKRVIYKVIGIVITLATGTFACCVVLFPYNFFDSYTNLIIKLALSAVLLVVIYISARMIVNAAASIKESKNNKADKDKSKAEQKAEELSVASHALKNRVKDIIAADKGVKSPAQKVSVNFDNYTPKYAAGKAAKEEAQSAQGQKAEQIAAKQTFSQALKDADEKILSQTKVFTESEAAAKADKPAYAERVSAASKDEAKPKPGAIKEPEQKAGAEEKTGTEMKVSEPVLEKPAEEKPDVLETKPEAQDIKASDALADKFTKYAAAGSQWLAEYEAEDKPEKTVDKEETTAETKAEEQAIAAEQAVVTEQVEVKPEETAAEAKAGEQAVAAEQAEAKEETAAEAKAEEQVVAAEQAEATPEGTAVEAKAEEQAVVVEQTETKPEEAAAEAKAEEQAVSAEQQSAAAPDRYAAIIIKARELISEERYVYAAELLQICSDRSEDEQQRKQADILIIECLALSGKGDEARSKWVEFLNKRYTLSEDDKANLKRVMSSL